MRVAILFALLAACAPVTPVSELDGIDLGRARGPGATTSVDLGDADLALPWRRYDTLLVRTDGARFVDEGGAAIDFRGAISCCGGGYGWPLFDEAWSDLDVAYGVGFLHARLGPFLTGDGGETDWAAIGGGYATSGGLADLDHFNDAFWTRVGALLEHAGARGQRVEVDVIDGWAIRHCRAGDTPGYSPWTAAGNVQGEDVCAQIASSVIAPGSRAEAWVRKLVRETGRFGNVLYQDGNEIGLVAGYDPAYTTSLAAIIRDEEQANGYLRHLVGSNAGSAGDPAASSVDYVELHQTMPADPSRCAGKPCAVNEYNPDPALTPTALWSSWCAARAAGTYYWYWRHGQTDGELTDTLSRIQAGCPP